MREIKAIICWKTKNASGPQGAFGILMATIKDCRYVTAFKNKMLLKLNSNLKTKSLCVKILVLI